ncbi:hypothetical protein LSAT2_022319 [Lamellibrachia satsuma]|nr:hypothetical protein LSAT2_022319 [Lamellibrachia satsuma]
MLVSRSGPRVFFRPALSVCTTRSARPLLAGWRERRQSIDKKETTPQSFETNTPLKTVPLLNPANRLLTLVEKFVPGTSYDDLDSTVQEWMDFQVATDLPEFIEVDERCCS